MTICIINQPIYQGILRSAPFPPGLPDYSVASTDTKSTVFIFEFFPPSSILCHLAYPVSMYFIWNVLLLCYSPEQSTEGQLRLLWHITLHFPHLRFPGWPSLCSNKDASLFALFFGRFFGAERSSTGLQAHQRWFQLYNSAPTIEYLLDI